VFSENGEIAIRLGVALLIGGVLGLNRDLHGNPAGLRTLSLVSLGAAIATMISIGHLGQSTPLDANATSRVLQGILTGVGFLGAGVILHGRGGHVTGLTTAATIWLCAALGAACGLGYWTIVVTAIVLTIIVLTVGGPLEHLVERLFKRKRSGDGNSQV
jgi:putative Mg2+ transporter-C (MgtC) family protein